MDGVLVVDKPSGPTSHDVVARVRRALGTRRVGHTGTLDPLATGVLPLVLGRATRLAQFLSSDDKEYVADVIFGSSTTTYDALGERLPSQSSEPVDLAELESALSQFRGTYLQRPPAFSAKKISGRPAYELARSGVAPELKLAEVTVTALEVMERSENTARLRMTCTTGFYVRTLAHELGQRLGCGAHLGALRRTRAGAFTLTDAVPLDALEREASDGAAMIVPLERLLPGLPAVVLTEEGVRRTSHGNLLPSSTQSSREGAIFEGPVRLLDELGRLVGIAEPEPGGVLHPVIVLM